MPRSDSFTIHPPLAGIERVHDFQRQRPYSAVESVNFLPLNVQDGRQVIATRPALSAFSGSLAVPDSPINMLASLNVPTPTLFAGCNGVLYKRSASDGTWGTISSSVGVPTGRAIFSSPFLKQLVIANPYGVPLLYDDDTETLVELEASSGSVPENHPLTMSFAGAVWFGGDPSAPHVFQASRIDDVTDYDFTQEDVQSAYISTGEQGGFIQTPLTAMFNFSASQAILACENELWVMTEHPNSGGRFDRISGEVGILGPNAWCLAPPGLFFLGHDGLFVVARNDFNNLTVTPVSRQKVPDELLDVAYDPDGPTACLAYDSRWNAVLIAVRDDDKPQAWWYSLDTGGFSKLELEEYPIVLMGFEPLVSEDTSGVLFGGNTLSRFDRRASEALDAYLITAPVKISPSQLDASIITQTAVALGVGSTDDDAVLELYGGGTPGAAVMRAQSQTGVAKASTTVEEVRNNNRNWWVHGVRGHAVCLRISQSNSSERVVFEDLYGRMVPAGMNVDFGGTAPVITPPSIQNLSIPKD